MSDGLDVCAKLKITLTEDQRRAIRYLEARGQTFCGHFGFQNAVEKAREHWNAIRRKRYAKKKLR